MANDTVVKKDNVEFQLKRGLKAVLDAKNEVYRDGQPIYEKDTHRLKIGNGQSAYVDLPYIADSSSDHDYVVLTELVQAKTEIINTVQNNYATKTSVSNLNKDLTDLISTKFSEVNTNINSLSTESKQADAKLNKALENTNKLITANTDLITDNKTAIEANKASVDNQLTDTVKLINANTDKIIEHNASIDDLIKNTDTLAIDMNQITKDLSIANELISSNTKAIDNELTARSELAKTVNSNSTAIQDILQEINGLSALIGGEELNGTETTT